MKIAFITAGAAGMFCGSCLRDNTLVVHLRKLGYDALLIPTYTPITTDEADASEKQVFLGGINVYLQEKSWLFRHTPRFLDKLLDASWLLRLAGKRAGSTKYEDLAGLTLNLLKGMDGHQRKEVIRLADWLADLNPEVVHLSNALISGVVPEIQRRLPRAKVVLQLQGDDIFLDAMPPAARPAIINQIRLNTARAAGFQATSTAYADAMAAYFGIDRSRITVVLPGIDASAFHPRQARPPGPPTLGYFARICPEKGFHNAVAAWLALRARPETKDTRLLAGGWLGAKDKPFFDEQLQRIRQAGQIEGFEYRDCPTHADKERILSEMDVFTLPTDYREPKGLSVLEAWATGVPVVLPAHGSFPELLEQALLHSAEPGMRYPPGDQEFLVELLSNLLLNPEEAAFLGQQGRQAVERWLNADRMAYETALWYESLPGPA
jgi:glycosyltransferase involved in cell wall biosynthesis